MPAKELRGSWERDPEGYYDKSLRDMQAIIDFIRDYRAEKGISPSYAEIAVGIGQGIQNQPNVSRLIKRLEDEGFLVHLASGARTIAVAPNPPRKVYYSRESEPETN